MRALRVVSGVALLVVLVACGGGPSPSAPVPSATPPPAKLATSAPAAAVDLANASPVGDELSGPKVKSVEIDLAYGCALYEDGRVACWGGAGPSGPSIVVDLPQADALRVGGGFACARAKGDRSLWCWGENHMGQLGRRKASSGSAPLAQVTTRSGAPLVVDDFIVGGAHACALAGGEVSCWGDSGDGQCGRMTKPPARGDWPGVLEPVVVFRGATRLFGGASTVCAVDERAQLWCWGGQDAGYSGHGAVTKPKPVAVEGRVQAMSFTTGHACLLNDAGSVFCRGWNPGGQLGSAGRPQKELDGKGAWHGDFEPRFVRITELGEKYKSVAVANEETCAVSTGGEVTCLGTPYWTQPIARNGVTAAPSPWRPHCETRPASPPASFPTPRPASGKGTSSLSSEPPMPTFTTWACAPRPEPGLRDVVLVTAAMGRRCTLHADGHARCVGERPTGGTRVIDDVPAVVDLPR